MLSRDTKIMITGSSGFLGKAVKKEFYDAGFHRLFNLSSKDCDLTNTADCDGIVSGFDPHIIIHLAAVVGGIGANAKRPGTFFYDNMMMGMNIIDSARRSGVNKFVQIGTTCSFPRICPTVPFKEEYLYQGLPEETNAPYGLAKLNLLTMLNAYQKEFGLNFIYLIPTNLYGPHDNFNENTSHVIPAIIKKIADAKKNNKQQIMLWGTGNATREFLYVDDCAKAIRYATEYYYDPQPVNLGSGEEIPINQLAYLIARLMNYNGYILYDGVSPDGQPRRCLDVTRAAEAFSFRAETSLEEGLKKTIEFYEKEYCVC